MSAVPQHANDPQLVLGRHPRDHHTIAIDDLRKAGRIVGQLTALHHCAIRTQQPDLTRYRRGGLWMIAGQHSHADAGAPARLEHARNAGPRRVLQGHQTEQREVAFRLCRRRRKLFACRQLTNRNRKHP